MSVRTGLISLLTLVTVCLLPAVAMSGDVHTITVEQTIGIVDHSEDQVKSACLGHYSLPNSQGRYYCVQLDGSAIACGGAAEVDKNSCDIFRLEGQVLKDTLALAWPTEPDQIDPELLTKACVKCDRGWCCK